MDQTLSYLSKYLAEPRVLSTLRADDPLMAELPGWWQALLAGGSDRVRQTLQAWEGHRSQLPQVFDFLAAHLRDVRLLTDKNLVAATTSVRLLYELERSDRTLYYAGGNPIQKTMTASVREAWDKLPTDFKRFYDVLHNGWYYLASNSMGPSPVEDFFVLDDLEWGILEDIDDPGFDLKDLLAVYTNGMGAYVALSVDRRAYGDVLWWKDKPPRMNIDALAIIDAWTQIGLSK
jgi:hypothetical protein